MVRRAGLPDKAVKHILKTASGHPRAWLLPYLGGEVTCADFWLKHIEKMKLIKSNKPRDSDERVFFKHHTLFVQ